MSYLVIEGVPLTRCDVCGTDRMKWNYMFNTPIFIWYPGSYHICNYCLDRSPEPKTVKDIKKHTRE